MAYRFWEVPTVTLFVGEDKRPFHVHRSLLCEASSFFKAAFEGNFRETSEQKMDLPEEDEGSFDLFVQWLYDRHYEIPLGWLERFLEPVKLYVLADKYDVRGLRSLIIEKLFEMGKQCMRTNKAAPGWEAMAYVYDHTSQNSGLRRLCADWYAWAAPLAWFSSNDSQKWLREHPEAACAIISSLAMARPGSSWADPINPFAGEMPENYKDN